jgi:SAM-dependent methyltransferase
MSSPAEFTGERFMPECTGEMWAEHWHRYLFASRLVTGLDVLDAACGEGYGAAWLAHAARSVTGLDIDVPTLEAARARYGRPGLSFEAGSVTAMPFADASFDCVVSFETLEHLAEQREMMAEMRRVLKPDGFLVISTPNRVEYSERRDFHNAFHVRELDAAEFRAVIAERFAAQRWYGQKVLFHSAIWPLPAGESSLSWIALDDARAMPEPMYYVALAAASERSLPAIGDTTLLADPDDTMYREYERTVARANVLERLTMEREALIESRDRALAERATQIAHLESLAVLRLAIIEERDRQIAAQAERATQLEAVVIDRDREAARRDERIAEAERVVAARDRLLAETNARTSALESLLRERERIIVERDAQLSAVNARMAEAERLIAERERIIVERDGQLAAVNARITQAEALIAERDAKLAEVEAQQHALQTEIDRRGTWRWWLQLPFVLAGLAPRRDARRAG